MSNYTKVNIRKDLYDEIKIRAVLDNRSIVNWLENFLLERIDLPAPPKVSNVGGDDA